MAELFNTINNSIDPEQYRKDIIQQTSNYITKYHVNPKKLHDGTLGTKNHLCNSIAFMSENETRDIQILILSFKYVLESEYWWLKFNELYNNKKEICFDLNWINSNNLSTVADIVRIEGESYYYTSHELIGITHLYTVEKFSHNREEVNNLHEFLKQYNCAVVGYNSRHIFIANRSTKPDPIDLQIQTNEILNSINKTLETKNKLTIDFHKFVHLRNAYVQYEVLKSVSVIHIIYTLDEIILTKAFDRKYLTNAEYLEIRTELKKVNDQIGKETKDIKFHSSVKEVMIVLLRRNGYDIKYKSPDIYEIKYNPETIDNIEFTDKFMECINSTNESLSVDYKILDIVFMFLLSRVPIDLILSYDKAAIVKANKFPIITIEFKRVQYFEIISL